jgi:hypothetical protein
MKTPFVTLGIVVVAALVSSQCTGSSSPTAATTTATTPAVSSVTLTATSLAIGASGQGTVTITAAAPTGGTSVSLSSSNPAVASVQTPVVVAAGSTTAAFTVTAIAAGTVTISASFNGGSRQSPTLIVTAGAPVTLSSISLSMASVVGGNPVIGTVTLSAAAPAGGAMVSLSGGDPVTVPATVTVPTGSASATFTISTRAVGGTIVGTVSASYGGSSASAMLSVTRPTVATASFGVTGPAVTDTCTLTNNGNTIDCTFDGSTSTAPGTIVAWNWTYGVATTFSQTTSGPQLSMPSVNCSLIPPPPLPAGVQWFGMIVTLQVRDNLGNVSAVVADSDVRLLPQGVCGF